jgi:hypothetical protein
MKTIVFFCSGQSIDTCKACLRYYYQKVQKNIDVYIVTPKKNAAAFKSETVKLIFDEDVVGYTEVLTYLNSVKTEILLKKRSVGWYLQQYLKIAVSYYNFPEEHIIVHDGDTAFSEKIMNLMLSSPVLLCTHEKNFKVYNNYLNAIGLKILDYSYVANANIFYSKKIATLLKGEELFTWFIHTLDKLVLPNADMDFSEYQLSATLLNSDFTSKQINFFRRFDLIQDSFKEVDVAIEHGLKRYNALAFEFGHHSTKRKKFIAKIAYMLGYRW